MKDNVETNGSTSVTTAVNVSVVSFTSFVKVNMFKFSVSSELFGLGTVHVSKLPSPPTVQLY